MPQSWAAWSRAGCMPQSQCCHIGSHAHLLMKTRCRSSGSARPSPSLLGSRNPSTMASAIAAAARPGPRARRWRDWSVHRHGASGTPPRVRACHVVHFWRRFRQQARWCARVRFGAWLEGAVFACMRRTRNLLQCRLLPRVVYHSLRPATETCAAPVHPPLARPQRHVSGKGHGHGGTGAGRAG